MDFAPTEEVGVHKSVGEIEAGSKGSHHQRKLDVEPTEKGGGKDEKPKIQMWSDFVKGLKIEDELKSMNSEKSRNESKTVDSVEMFDSEELN